MAANTGFFKGKTVVISGASRGIGLSIALKLARDGANIAIFAKTATVNPKLPGTIYTAAEEIEKIGGQCLPVQCDIREEQNVTDAVDQTVKKFGGIDILINNASAVSPTSTLDTAIRRYDLMNNVNTRGTFLMSRSCIPYLKNGKNAHILNLSPPLSMEAQWFAPHIAYTIAKFGMSMCVLGMHEELRSDKIAVNALWPRSLIWTAAMKIVAPGPNVEKGCRKPEIMADAAYVMLSKPSDQYTGNFAIDDEVLSEAGIKNFDQYACDPKGKLIIDGFVPGGEHINPKYRKSRA
jgi:citronellol/citronellal dehydrogenase